MEVKLKLLFFLFLIDLTENSLFQMIAARYSNTYANVYIYMHAYVYECLCISEMSDSSDTKDKMGELGMFCYYKALHTTCEMLFHSGLELVTNAYCKL